MVSSSCILLLLILKKKKNKLDSDTIRVISNVEIMNLFKCQSCVLTQSATYIIKLLSGGDGTYGRHRK